MKRFETLFVIMMILVVPSVKSQLQVTTAVEFPRSWTPDSLVRNVLLSEGEEVYNIKFGNMTDDSISCNALGTFSTGSRPTNLGIRNGIVISTGHVYQCLGPNTTTNMSSQADVCNEYIDASLEALAYPNVVRDASTLEFDFIPKSDTIRFRYVFGSEEYPEFVGGNYNDLFGFFISGLKPSGGSYNNFNIAQIPNTSQPISINTVNHRQNSEYYVDNTDGSTIQFDGFTTVLTAKAAVVPCQTYHLKISICDVGDDIYNSAVFLEANSFSSNTISTSYTNPNDLSAPLEIHEGCYGVNVNFSRPLAESTNKIIPITIGGTATNGVDYQPVSPYIIFQAGETEYNLTISPIMDGEEEDDETVELIFHINECETDTIVVTIHDVKEMEAKISYTPPTVDDTAVVLTATVQHGYITPHIPYEYLWNTGETSQSIVVPTIPTANYWYTATDRCKSSQSDTVTIGVLRDFAYTQDDAFVCLGDSAYLRTQGADFSVWCNGDTANSITVYTEVDKEYTVTSWKYWNRQWWSDTDTINVIVKPNPIAKIKLQPEVVTTANPLIKLIDISTDGYERIWNFETDESKYESSVWYTMPYRDSVVVELISFNSIRCTDTTHATVYMISEEIWVPNTFTPTQTTNNRFEIKARNINSFHIQIYNRLGETVYQSNDINNHWDGTKKDGSLVPQDSYVYIIKYTTNGDKQTTKTKIGTVTVLF